MPRKTYRKVIVTDEILAKINKENIRIVERYLRNFDTKRSDKSVIVKRSDYNIFLCWNYLYNDNKLIPEIKKYELMDYFDFGVNELGWGTSRFNSMHSSLNTLFNFIENFMDEDYIGFKNNMSKIEKPVKQVAREKTVLTEEQVDSLLEHLRNDSKDYQQLVCLLLFISSGVRISECLRITTDLIDENNLAFGDHFLKTTKKIKTKGFGKKGEPKFKYFLKDMLLEDYKIWLTQRAEFLKKKGKEHNYVLLKSNGDPATIDVINHWVRKWEDFLTNDEKTNPKKEQLHIYPHCFRHFLCSQMARKGISQELVVAVYGWKSSDMFNIYNDCDEDERTYADIDKLGDVF